MIEPGKLHLIFQGNIEVTEPAAGHELYNELKIFLQAYSPNATLNGQLMQLLEPCCNKPKGDPNNENLSQTTER